MPTSLPRELRELVAQLVDLGALLADHDARPAGVHRDDDLARLALDDDVGDRRVPEARLQILAEQLVFAQQRRQIASPRTSGTANRFEMPSRKPIGCVFCPISVRSPSRRLGDLDLDVARPLAESAWRVPWRPA